MERLVLFVASAAIGLMTTVSAQAKDIVHDTEYYVLEAQNGEQWANDDEAVDRKLAEFKKTNGETISGEKTWLPFRYMVTLPHNMFETCVHALSGTMCFYVEPLPGVLSPGFSLHRSTWQCLFCICTQGSVLAVDHGTIRRDGPGWP